MEEKEEREYSILFQDIFMTLANKRAPPNNLSLELFFFLKKMGK